MVPEKRRCKNRKDKGKGGDFEGSDSQVLAHPGNAADNENDTLNSCDKPER